MADKSAIEWTDATWNPIVGCSILSPGCTNCYAMKMAARIQKMNRTGGSNSNYVNHYDGTTKSVKGNAVWTGKLAMAPDKLFLKPLSHRAPTTYFVNSMGDLFHEDCPDEWIDKVFAVMELSPQHTFQVLTKRAARMQDYCSTIQKNGRWLVMEDIAQQLGYKPRGEHDRGFDWISHKQFLPNVWLGVSTERQQEADERIPLLLQTPAAIRFVSAEPLLAPIDLSTPFASGRPYLGLPIHQNPHDESWHQYGRSIPHLDWVIAGGESGPNARPMHPDWARLLRDQCAAAGVNYFFKQWGEWAPGECADFAPSKMERTATWFVDDWSFGALTPRESEETHVDDAPDLYRIGKKRAGRKLDGELHNGMPAVRA